MTNSNKTTPKQVPLRLLLPKLPLLLILILLLLLHNHNVVQATPTKDGNNSNSNSNNNDGTCESSTTTRPTNSYWKPREGHHEPSSALIGTTASVWTYKSGRHQDDPRSYQVRYKLHHDTTTTDSTKSWNVGFDFKYEFSCVTLPKLAISADGTTFAIGCTQQDVTRYDGQVLTSKQGHVTVFRWNPSKQKCQVLGNLYGTETDEQFGRSLALNDNGDILAIAGKEPSHLYVFQYDSQLKQWNQRGQTLEDNNHKVLISNDGMILPVIKLVTKAVRIYHFNVANNIWEMEDIVKHSRFTIVGRSSSLALSGNGQVMAVQLVGPGRKGAIGVGILHRSQLSDGSFVWDLDPFAGFIPSPSSSSSFGLTTSLNIDGTRIAIADPAHAVDGHGRVYIFDYEYNSDSQTFSWVLQGDPLVGTYPKDGFGRHLYLSQDATTLVVRSVSYSMIYQYHPPPKKFFITDGNVIL